MSRAAAVFLWGCLAASGADAEGLELHDYLLNCSGCHKADGLGSSTVPSLRALAGLPLNPQSRSYLVRVPGVAHAPLTDARLARLLNWVVARFTGRVPFPPYGPQEVGELRRSPLLDPRAAREQIVNSER